MSYFFKALQIMGIITDWSAKAMADGKITLTEAVDLAQRVAQVLDIPCQIDLPK